VPILRKNAGIPALKVMDRHRSTPYGGLLLIEALCRRCDFWNQINEKQFPLLKNSGLGPRPAESIIAQLLFSLAQGAAGLSEAAMLRDDPLLMRLIGLKHAADEKILKAWLVGQTESSLNELRRLNSAFVRWALPQCCPAKTGDKKNPIDVTMRTKRWYFSMATRSIAESGLDLVQLCWRTLAVGPFLLDGLWSVNPDGAKNAAQFEELLTLHCSTWKDYEAYFCSGNLPDAATWRRVMDAIGFALWTAEVDDYFVRNDCDFDPDSPKVKWKLPDAGDTLAEGYCLAYPQGTEKHVVPGIVAIARRKRHGGTADCYASLVVSTMLNPPTQALFSRHYDVDLVMDQMLDGLNMNRVVSLEDNARAAYFVFASLANNLLMALRLFLMPHAKHRTMCEIVRGIIMTPAVLSTSGNRNKLYLGVTDEWPPLWRDFVEQSMPGAGRRPRKAMIGKSETEA